MDPSPRSGRTPEVAPLSSSSSPHGTDETEASAAVGGARAAGDRQRVRGPRRPPGAEETAALPTLPRVGGRRWPRPWLTRLLVVLSVTATGLYVGWWLAPGHVGNPVVFALLAGAELFTVIHVVGLWQAVWAARIKLPPPASTSFRVDVFIPTYGEDLDGLHRTIRAAVAVDGPHRTYVLDDAERDEVRELAHELGASYIPRASSQGAKAGNLNHALARTDGDLIVVFDADHVARRDFLTHVLGYFEDPEVAVVQTPQFYGNALVNRVAAGAWYQQVPFYGTVMRGKHGLNAVFLCGTNAILRRAALDDVGGFEEESVVEDMATSIRLQQRGWSGVYFPYVLAEGEGPTTLRAYFSQQFRWANGSLSAFRQALRGGFDPVQRVQYLLSTTYYLIGMVTAIYIAMPVLGLLFDITPFGPDADAFPLFYVPHILLALLLIRRSLRGRFSLRNTRFTFGAFPVYIAGAVAAFTGREVSFTPTASQEERRPPWLAWVTVATAGLLVLALIGGAVLHPFDDWSWISAAWAVLDLYLLWPIVSITLREAFGGDEIDTGVPQLVGRTGAHSTALTYLLGAFEEPPLPEDVVD
ncbi:MAG: glycosyltransferase [Actinobacteria bacterium]|nr:glycosyltransferase [Actinomycetota bacterium]